MSPSAPASADKSAKKAAAVTPAMAQYFRLKEAHPDCLLFFRMGDFYELFFEDAVQASAALAITLTKRGKHGDDDVPMCGVPVHAADTYLARLIRAGFRVAVCEQLENPAEAKKRGAKSVVKRDVVRIVTPGTLTEDSLLTPTQNNYLAALAEAEGNRAVAWLDMSTGAFTTAQGDVQELLGQTDPRELLIADTLAGEPAFADWQSVITPQPQSRFSSTSGLKQLCAAFHVDSLDAFGDFSRAEIAAAGALLDYVELTQKGARPALQPLTQQRDDAVMAIDPATRRNLNLHKGPDGGRSGSLLACIDRTRTAAGARLLSARLASPLFSVSRIAARLDAVDSLIAAPRWTDQLASGLKAAPDLERAVQRLSLGRGGPRDLAACRDGLMAADRLLGSWPSPADLPAPGELADVRDQLAHDGDLLQHLQAGLADDLPALVRDGGFIRPGYSAELDEQRELRDESRRLIAALSARYAKETGVASLKIKYNKLLGYLIEVATQHADKVKTGADGPFIHRQTLANAVRFTTAELAELEKAILAAGDKVQALEADLFEKMTARSLDQQPVLMRIAGALAVLDVNAGLADLAADLDWTRPALSSDTGFSIEGGRHPVVEAALKADGKAFISNACALGPEDRLWLLTGPNMAGKSTFLRQNALIAILAQTGAFVPAARAQTGLVDRVFSRVGAADDLARGRSTFMVEMVETAAILRQATPRSLVILDEIGRGTATYDGLSIAWATVEHLHEQNRCRALFATHYHELTALDDSLPALSCHSLRVKEWQDEVLFLHEVVAGTANRSYGLNVAALAGLPQPVLDRAKQLLAELESKGSNAAPSDLPLFAAPLPAPPPPARPNPALKLLDQTEPDSLSPREALDILYALKEAAADV